MRELGWHFFHGTGAFAQFEPDNSGDPGMDLMFVDAATWEKLADPQEQVMRRSRGADAEFRTSRCAQVHAASRATRSKPEVDWEDIRQIVRICGLDIGDPEFHEIVLRYGGEEAVRRIESFRK